MVGMASTGEAWRLGRRPALIAGSALCLPIAVANWGANLGDRQAAEEGAGALLSGDFAVYVHVAWAQMGPLALLLWGALPRVIYVALICAAMPATLLLASTLTPAWWKVRWFFIAAVILARPWTMYAVSAHGDEALVTVGGIVMAWGCVKKRPGVVAAAFVVALAGKPTAALLLPLLLCVPWRYRLLALAWGGLVWLPFFLADPVGFLHAGRGITSVWPGSFPALVGVDVGSPFPFWLRPLQLVSGLVLGWFVLRRSGPAAALVAGLAVRSFMEPAAWSAYSSPMLAAAFLVDAHLRRRVPWTVLLTAAGYVVAMPWPMTAEQGGVRLLLIAAAVVAASRSGSDHLDDGESAGGREGGAGVLVAPDLEVVPSNQCHSVGEKCRPRR